MKPLRFLAQALFLSATLVAAHAQATNTNTILGQWDFDTTQLETATVGDDLQFIGFQPASSTFQIGTNNIGAMSFPALTSEQRILATFAPTNNGGGTNLNQYTIIMDVMYPAESEGTWRGLFNTDTSNTDSADMFIDPDGRVGINNNYAAFLQIAQWYRLALVVNITNATGDSVISRYTNGTSIGDIPLPANSLNGRFSLSGGILFFSDALGDTAPGFVNVIQLRAGAMTTNEIAALGGPVSNGLGQGTGVPVGDVRISGIQFDPQNNTITITIDSGGRNVQLQRSATIVNPQWSNIGNPSPGPFTVPNQGGIAFFRVQLN